MKTSIKTLWLGIAFLFAIQSAAWAQVPDPATRSYKQTSPSGNPKTGVEILDGSVEDGDGNPVSFGYAGASNVTAMNISGLTQPDGITLKLNNKGTGWFTAINAGYSNADWNYATEAGVAGGFALDWAVEVNWDLLTTGAHVLTFTATYSEGPPTNAYFGVAYTITITAIEDGSLTGPQVVAPTITTSAASSIGQYSAVLNGSVTATGEENPVRYFFNNANSAEIVNLAAGGVGAFNHTWNGLSPNTSYSYFARGTNSGGTGNGTPQSFLTLPADPAANAYTNLTPTKVTANWNASFNGANYYEVQISTVSNFASVVSTQTPVGTSCNFTGLSPETDYYYRVRAWNASGASGYSNTVSLTTPISTPHTQASNIQFSNISRTGITVRWARGSGNNCVLLGRARYSIPNNPLTNHNVYSSANLNYTTAQTVSSSKVLYTGTQASANISGLTRYSLLYFKIFEYNYYANDEVYYLQTEASNNSRSRWTLRRDGVLAEDDFASGIEASIYPNPTSDRINISIDMPFSDLVTAELISSDGKLAKAINFGMLNEGEQVLSSDLSDLSSGVYLLSIKFASEQVVGVIEIIK